MSTEATRGTKGAQRAIKMKGDLRLRHGLFVAFPTARDVNLTSSGFGGFCL